MTGAKEETKKDPIVSHGRGGQGNIGADPTQYVDGEIVRSGPTGDQGDGAYSAGRGGAGNIGSPHIRPSTPGQVHDTVVVPDMAIRNSSDGDYHIGRGGQGNVHLDESHKPEATAEGKKKVTVDDPKPATASKHKSTPSGLADKLKMKILGRK